MSHSLKISLGQHSDKGRKEINQDFHGACVPNEPQLSAKGVAIALADGISSSSVSQIASQAAVTSFLDDYFCTSEALSVRKSAQQVLLASNSWLHAQTQDSPYRYERDRGYLCTFSALVIKSNTAHLFHVGDSRIYRVQDSALEQLTQDHRVQLSAAESYLNRAMGLSPQLELDYHALAVEPGDLFVLATDGVYEYVNATFIIQTITHHADDLDQAACLIVSEALTQGSPDNLTIQIVRIDDLAEPQAGEVLHKFSELPLAPILHARMQFDGYEILRELHASSRSRVYLARDLDTDTTVVLKTPAIDIHSDNGALERFMMEDWIARRLNSAHVLKPFTPNRARNYLYVVTEYIEGQSLTQWMRDHPKPDVESARKIIEQIARGLQAFHRMEMLHQDLRPENILIDVNGTVKIIDFGSTRVAGIMEMDSNFDRHHMLGTFQYMAPEYFLGELGTPTADLFSLGVIAYQMLSGHLPYGAEVAKTRTAAEQRKLIYHSVLAEDRAIPAWLDEVLKKAVHTNPLKRYAELSEFVYDLRHPNQAYLSRTRPSLMERNPVKFWQTVSLLLFLVVVYLLIREMNYVPPQH